MRDHDMSALLIAVADALMRRYDFCGIRGCACKGGDPNPCCINSMYGPGLCPHWQDKCTNPNPDCKLWICETAIKTCDPNCLEQLKTLEAIGRKYDLVHEPFIGDPYVGADKQP